MALEKLFVYDANSQRHRERITEWINGILDGRLRVTGEFTLAASTTTTVVTDNLFEAQQVPVFVPLTANAAAALATTHVSAREAGQFTVTHANNAQTDRTFAYVRFG